MSGGTVSIIAVVAFVLSALSFIGAQWSASRNTHLSAEDRCKDDLDRSRAEVERLRNQVQLLQDENFSLMRKLMSKDMP